MSREITFGRIRGQIEYTSQPQTIDGYDLEFITFKFIGLSGQIIDGARIKLGKQTPPQLVVRGTFRELVKLGKVRIDVVSNNQTTSHYPNPYDNSPILVEENSRMQITNLGTTPAEIIELSLPGFEKCILINL
ncbi:hypothetical protein KBC75_01415 [Candidatus Shapirobacteria bacterium]|nr:hypothetical protein [Candidatus Shapirobacteria bacterium]